MNCPKASKFYGTKNKTYQNYATKRKLYGTKRKIYGTKIYGTKSLWYEMTLLLLLILQQSKSTVRYK